MMAESLLRKDMHERHTIELEYGRQLNRLDSHKSLGKLQLKYANSLANADSWQDFLSAERDMLNSRLQLVNNLMSNSTPTEASSLSPPLPAHRESPVHLQREQSREPQNQQREQPVQLQRENSREHMHQQRKQPAQLQREHSREPLQPSLPQREPTLQREQREQQREQPTQQREQREQQREQPILQQPAQQVTQPPPVEPTKAGKMLVKRGDVVSGWKSRWFSLKEGILYCYDTPSTGESPGRPRDVINLTSAKVYPLHESYFHRPHCFQIILLEPGRIVFNLVAENARERDSWIAALRPECCSSCDATPNEFKTIRGLDVKILEAKGI
jgi:outer membrane biosynthesis protein TonB